MQTTKSIVMFSTMILLALGGCDTREDVDTVDVEREASPDVLDIDWEAVPLPPALASELGVDVDLEPAIPTAGPNGWQFEIETFRNSTSTAFAVTSAPGNLFAPIPADIALFDEPQLASSMFIGWELLDDAAAVIGFGSEQLELDYQELEAQTTFTLTLPGRGTLMLAHSEDMAPGIDEANDMMANNEYIRSYDSPWIFESTIPGTGKVIGGTGEFAGAKGVMREFVVIHKLDLLSGYHDLEGVIQVALLPGAGKN